MIDEKKIEEAAGNHAGRYFGLPKSLEIGKWLFKKGACWLLDNLRHYANERPIVNKEVFIQLKEDGSWHSAIFDGRSFNIKDMNKDDKYSVQLAGITRWIYIDDLLKGEK